MVHSICDSYPKFGAAAPRQTGVITRRKKWGRLTPPPANAGVRCFVSACYNLNMIVYSIKTIRHFVIMRIEVYFEII